MVFSVICCRWGLLGGLAVWALSAAYAFGDPFESPVPTGRQGCAMSPYPRSDLPLYLLERACDAGTPCDAMQRVSFRAAAGLEASRWSTRLQTDIGDPNVSLQLIDERGAPEIEWVAQSGVAANDKEAPTPLYLGNPNYKTQAPSALLRR